MLSGFDHCEDLKLHLESKFQQGYDLGTLLLTNREGNYLGAIFLSSEKNQRDKFIQAFFSGFDRTLKKAK